VKKFPVDHIKRESEQKYAESCGIAARRPLFFIEGIATSGMTG
jgi:hypothetical protein